jgi:septum formation protein
VSSAAPPTLHLASASPRRRALLRALGLPFTVDTPPLDEQALEAAYSGPAAGLAEYLACAKAAATLADLEARGAEPTLVLTADTTVLLDGRSLGKPRDAADAAALLRALRGRAHEVVTGVALARSHAGVAGEGASRIRSTAVTTRVHMRAYSDAEIAGYVASGDPLDKAGAYGVQHPDFQPVERVAGCYLAVVGLPLCAVAALLADFGVAAAAPGEAAAPDAPRQPCPWSERCRPPLPTFPRD